MRRLIVTTALTLTLVACTAHNPPKMKPVGALYGSVSLATGGTGTFTPGSYIAKYSTPFPDAIVNNQGKEQLTRTRDYILDGWRRHANQLMNMTDMLEQSGYTEISKNLLIGLSFRSDKQINDALKDINKELAP